MKYTFETVNYVTVGSSYGLHQFTVDASSWREAWDKVRQLTTLALRKVSVT